MENNYPVNETVKMMQSLLFEILVDIDAVCRKNNICYFLSGGTLLGAIRHKGFIPWDDDGDVMMPREDYRRFFNIFEQEFGDKYGIGELSIDDEWNTPYGIIWNTTTKLRSLNLNSKEVGVGIDIFPIDGVSDSPAMRKIFFQRIRILNGFRNACLRNSFLDGEKFVFLKRFIHLLVAPFGARFFAKRMNALAEKISIGKTKHVASSVAAHYGEKETMDIKSIMGAIEVDFETTRFMVPIGYEQYLTNIYGDYMTIPKDIAQKGVTHLDHWIVELGEKE